MKPPEGVERKQEWIRRHPDDPSGISRQSKEGAARKKI